MENKQLSIYIDLMFSKLHIILCLFILAQL